MIFFSIVQNFSVIGQTSHDIEIISWKLLEKQGVSGEMSKEFLSNLDFLNLILEYCKVIMGHPLYHKDDFYICAF